MASSLNVLSRGPAWCNKHAGDRPPAGSLKEHRISSGTADGQNETTSHIDRSRPFPRAFADQYENTLGGKVPPPPASQNEKMGYRSRVMFQMWMY